MLKFRTFINIFLAAGLILLSACSPSAPAATPTQSPIKAAVLLEGPLADTGWNTSSWQALQDLSKKYGWDVKYTDNVKTEDMEDLLRSYAQKDYDILFGPGWLWGEPMMKVSKEFPKTRFVHVAVNTTAGDNFSSLGPVAGEMEYFAGRVSGKLSKSGKLAFIGGTESPMISYGKTTFEQGAKEINPNASVNMTFVGSWADPAKAKELAKAQIEAGADIIMGEAGSGDFGIMEAIKDAKAAGKDVKYIGFVGDTCPSYSEGTLLSIIQLPGDLIRIAGDEFQNGNLKSGHSVYGVKEGAQRITWCGSNVSEDLQKEIESMIKEYTSGKLTTVPFRTDL